MSKQPNAIFAETRQQELVELVNANGSVTVTELCTRFGVSPATIRKDLNDLERGQYLRRVHGGAISISENLELTSKEKLALHVTQKRQIAQLARGFVQPGSVIAVDTGTTTLEFAKEILDIPNLTIITNDLKIAQYLEENSQHSIVFLGGVVRTNFHCTVGNMVTDALDTLHIDTYFAATNAVSLEWGLSTPSIDMANVKRKLLQNSGRCVLLADSSKIGGASMARFATLDQIQVLVTDSGANGEFLAGVKALGVQVCL